MRLEPPRPRNDEERILPLINIVFLLLIFFMLASSFLDWRSIELNAPAKTAAGSPMEGALLVEIRRDGLRLSGEAVSLDGLAARVAKRTAAKPDQQVLVRPAAGVALQEAVQVLDRLAAAGASELSLIRSGRR